VRKRKLAGTDLAITEIGFGGAPLGNLFSEVTDSDVRSAVDEAWARGVRYFDTAPHYGLGLSERRLGAALAAYPRDEYILSTKVGRLLVPNERPTEFDNEGFMVPGDVRREWDFTEAGIHRSLDESLERLGMERVDLLLLHDTDLASPLAGRQGAEVLVELRETGVVRAVGVGTNSAAEAADLLTHTGLDCAMLAGRYTLLEQDARINPIRVAENAGKSIIAVGIFNSGLLANDRPSADAKYNYADAPRELIDRANRIADLCASYGVTLPEAAIQFPLRNSTVAGVAIGMRTAAQVARNVELSEASIPGELWTALASVLP
jgi:D-threo-aldose 1-dehydrogenase